MEFDDGAAARLTSVGAIRDFLRRRSGTTALDRVPGDSAADAPGSSGVRSGRTSVTKIDGTVPEIRYRGYSVVDLARTCSFEETAHCLLYGELPTRSQLSDFTDWLVSERKLSEELVDTIGAFRREPTVNAVIAALAADAGWVGDSTFEELAVALIAKLPTLVATHAALARELPPPVPSEDPGHAANLLYMLRGRTADPAEAKALDTTFVMQMDHGLAPSTTSSRAAVGVGADVRLAVVAGIAAFSGSLHAGAVAEAMQVQATITDADSARMVARRWRAGDGRPYGFGHRVHKSGDPRSRPMRDTAADLADALGRREPIEQIDLLVEAVTREWRGTLPPNYDGYAAAIYRLLGIDAGLATAVFTCARVVGLLSHVAEQLGEPFVMPPPPEYLGPLDRALPVDSPLDAHDRR